MSYKMLYTDVTSWAAHSDTRLWNGARVFIQQLFHTSYCCSGKQNAHSKLIHTPFTSHLGAACIEHRPQRFFLNVLRLHMNFHKPPETMVLPVVSSSMHSFYNSLTMQPSYNMFHQ